MPRVLKNEHESLEFTFDDDWVVCEWDSLPDFRDPGRIGRLECTHAVDFIGIYRQSELYFIEIKDCRPNPTEKRSEIGGPLAILVAQKIRDSIAAVVSANRHRDDDRWLPHVDLLRDRVSAVRVVLFLELIPTNPLAGRRSRWVQSAPVDNGVMSNALKQHLSWLRGRVQVVNHRRYDSVPGLSVRNLHGAGMPDNSRTSS